MKKCLNTMIRIQIRLEDEQCRELRKIEAAEGKGFAEQIQEAIRLYLSRRRDNLPPLDDLCTGFQPLPEESLDEPKPLDRWMAAGILESKLR